MDLINVLYKNNILLLISSAVYANSININEEIKFVSILQNAQIYIDKNRDKKIEDIKSR